MGIPGENLAKVHHYFKEGHPFFDQNVFVIGGKNSAIDAALEFIKQVRTSQLCIGVAAILLVSNHGYYLNLKGLCEMEKLICTSIRSSSDY